VRAPKQKEALAERILAESDAHRLLALEQEPRNHVFLRLLYLAGLRISEACAPRWRDLQPRQDGGQVTVFGKGGKTRVVLLPAASWGELVALRAEAGPDAPVFRSRSGGGANTPKAGHEIVKRAVARAGLSGDGVDAGIECLGNLAVTPGLAGFRGIGL
jgi:integrase